MIILVALVFFVFGYLLGKKRPKNLNKTVREWISLPSGWSKDMGNGHCAYATVLIDSNAYWWISRKGKTWIEGPAPNIEMAKREIDSVLKEFNAL